MKQAQNARKQRGKNHSRQGGRPNNGAGNRSEQKVRGNPKQLIEKYKAQARDAIQAGDRVQAEYFYQFADHYYRVSAERNSQQNDGDNRRGRRRGGDQRDNQNNAEEAAPAKENAASGENVAAQDTTTGDAAELPASILGPKPDLGETAQPQEVRADAEEGEQKQARAPRRRAPRRKPEAEASADVQTENASDEQPKKPRTRRAKPAEAPLLDNASDGGEAA